jgi:hypothetical protein
MAIRKDRLQKEKDILQAITPWIVTGICMLGLVAIAYVQINGFIEISDNLKVASEQMASVATSYSLPTTQTVAVPVTKPRTAENANNDYASIPSIE